MTERPGSDSAQDFRPMDPRLKKQIAIVFLLSVIGSSFMIFFAVVDRTERYMEEERKKQESALIEDEPEQDLESPEIE